MSATATPTTAPQEASTVITSYKGFDADWTCRGYQYAVGQTYEHDGAVSPCHSGFHACEYPLHVLRYYKPGTSRFAVVEQSGDIARHGEDSKVASSRITIKAEIDIAGLIKAAVEYTVGRSKPEPGATLIPDASCAEIADLIAAAATASGDYGAATASGYYGAATASGRNGKARGREGCALFLTYRDSDWKIVHAKALIVGREGIKADTYYRLDAAGNAVEAA